MHRWWAVVAASGVIIAALYLLWAYQRVFHGTPEGDNATMRDLTFREGCVLAPLVVGIVFLGIYPKPVLDRIEPSVVSLVEHIERHDPDFHEPSPAIVVGDAGEGAARTEKEGGH